MILDRIVPDSYKKWSTLIGSFLIKLSLGSFFTVGNMSPYIIVMFHSILYMVWQVVSSSLPKIGHLKQRMRSSTLFGQSIRSFLSYESINLQSYNSVLLTICFFAYQSYLREIVGEEDVRNDYAIWMQSSIHISLASATLFNGLFISIYNVNFRWLILAGTFLMR